MTRIANLANFARGGSAVEPPIGKKQGPPSATFGLRRVNWDDIIINDCKYCTLSYKVQDGCSGKNRLPGIRRGQGWMIIYRRRSVNELGAIIYHLILCNQGGDAQADASKPSRGGDSYNHRQATANQAGETHPGGSKEARDTNIRCGKVCYLVNLFNILK